MEKKPYNFEDVNESVDQIRNLIDIYDDLVNAPNWELKGFPAKCVLDDIMKSGSIIRAVMSELRTLSDGVKTTLEIEEQARERRAVR